MDMTVEHAEATVPVAILKLQGALDASNFEAVVTKASEILTAGTRHLLIDMGDLSFMSSSGLVALHSILLLGRGEQPHDPQAGWEAFHTIERELGSGPQASVKLLNPQPKVAQTLRISGMEELFEVYTDKQAALASF